MSMFNEKQITALILTLDDPSAAAAWLRRKFTTIDAQAEVRVFIEDLTLRVDKDWAIQSNAVDLMAIIVARQQTVAHLSKWAGEFAAGDLDEGMFLHRAFRLLAGDRHWETRSSCQTDAVVADKAAAYRSDLLADLLQH